MASRYSITALCNDDLYGRDVMEDVWKGINCAATIIADCSGRNANVFYELGIAHTIGRQTILLVQNKKEIPFDIGRFRYIRYSVTRGGKLTPKEANAFQDQLRKHLSACMNIKMGA